MQSFSTVVDSARCPDGVKALPGADQVDCAQRYFQPVRRHPRPGPGKVQELLAGPDPVADQNVDVLVDYYHIRKEKETALLSAQYVVEHPDLYPGAAIRATNRVPCWSTRKAIRSPAPVP